MELPFTHLPTIDHVGFLEDQLHIPSFIFSQNDNSALPGGYYSCSFCGVGDSGVIRDQQEKDSHNHGFPPEGEGVFKQNIELPAQVKAGHLLEITATTPLCPPNEMIQGELTVAGNKFFIVAREVKRQILASTTTQQFMMYNTVAKTSRTIIQDKIPTTGCVKLRTSMGMQKSIFPIHTAPSLLKNKNERVSLTYQESIEELAKLLLEHRPPYGRTLIYACGQVDYFTIFSFQEVFRLLGVRNLTGNAEHCLNSGAVHNEILTGQEGPFLTIDQGLSGENRFFLLNGWNGLISHPPAFYQLLKRKDFDGYLIEVVVTESCKMLASKYGADRILLIRSGSDPHLVLGIAHEILANYSHAIESRFIEQYSDAETFEKFVALAKSEEYEPEKVAARIAPEPSYKERLLKGIKDIAFKLAQSEKIPINIPSVGLSQTKGVVTHCLWGSLFAMLGKYGLKADGTPAGGTLRIPGQINAQTEIQGLSRKSFMGRIPVNETGAVDAARRMGLPDDAYQTALQDTPRAALDYSDPAEPGMKELFICFGTQFESNMMERSRWIKKLEDPNTTLVVVDPILDSYTLEKALLAIPSPPHSAAAKLYQNGEWRFTLSLPLKKRPKETRTDATIVYDTMAEVTKKLMNDKELQEKHLDLKAQLTSGYLSQRFMSPEDGGGLTRVDGEVAREELWERVLSYMKNGEGRNGAVYCEPVHASGTPIQWSELVEKGSIIYGGVGENRYCLDYEKKAHHPFSNIYQQPVKFKFFLPTEKDLSISEDIILNSGRSSLSDDKARIRFATATFNSGKATTAVDIPAENPLYISLSLAQELKLTEGERVQVTNKETNESLVFPVVPTDRAKGKTVYVSFHKSKAELENSIYLNTLTSHQGRCPYSAQSNLKLTPIEIKKIEHKE